jgi:DNA-binding NarL/FixJ family response regulator
MIINGVPVWRQVLVDVINRAPNLKVCGAAFHSQSALAKVRQWRPDLVLADILRLQDLGFIRQLHRRHPDLPILAFSLCDEEVYGPRALEAGACGYLNKNVGAEEFLSGIRKALRGRRVLSRDLARLLRHSHLAGFAKCGPGRVSRLCLV